MGLYVFEGADGSGKTTILANVKHRLEAMMGIDSVVSVKYPGETELGAHIRTLLLHGQKDMDEPLTQQAQATLMLADMHLTNHLKVVPALKDEKIVLCDRYFLSTFVYQFLSIENYGIAKDSREQQDAFFRVGGMFRYLVQPKRTFVISAAKEVVSQRLQQRNVDFFESDWENRWEIYKNLPKLLSSRFQIEGNIHFIERENNNEIDLEEISAKIANSIYIDCNPGRFNAVG